MGLFGFMSTLEESKERHSSKDLMTHYYKCAYNKVKTAVLDYAKQQKLDVRSINDEHGEIYLQSRSYHMIVSIIQVNPLETAMDVKVQSYQVLGLYKPKKKIMDIYQYCNSKLTFKGVGLHP